MALTVPLGNKIQSIEALEHKSRFCRWITTQKARLIHPLDQSLGELVIDSLARQDNCFLELSYLCRSLANGLTDGSAGERNFISNFQAGILLEPGSVILASDSAHGIRLEALRSYSMLKAANYPAEKADGNKISEKQEALFDKADTYMRRGKYDKDQGNFFEAFINYSIAAWMIRADINTDPSCSLNVALHKKNKMRVAIQKVAAEKLPLVEKQSASKSIQETSSKKEEKVSSVAVDRAAAIARELELEEEKTERNALKKEKKKMPRKPRLKSRKKRLGS